MKRIHGLLIIGFLILTGWKMAKLESVDRGANSVINITDKVYFEPFPYTYCTPGPIAAFTSSGVEISLEYKKDGVLAILNSVTDATGIFSFTATGVTSKVITEKVNISKLSTDIAEGLDMLDFVRIQYHVNQFTPLNCPISRIAADFNFDGKIDSDDATQLNQLIRNGNCDAGCPPNNGIWRFVPLPYITSSTTHSDRQFIEDFWNITNPDNNIEGDYPFAAKLNHRGKEYTYNGTESWLNKVENWDYFPSTGLCDESNYGFWQIKAGDVSYSIANSSSLVNSNYNLQFQTKLAETNQYQLKVKVKSQKAIAAYQLGLFVDSQLFTISNINAIETGLNQSLIENFPKDSNLLANGQLKTTWYKKNLKNPEDGVAFNDWQEIISLDIETKKALDPNQDFTQFIFLDESILATKFIAGLENIPANKLEIVVEISPK